MTVTEKETLTFISEQCQSITVEVCRGNPGARYKPLKVWFARPLNFTSQLTEACAFYNRWVASLLGGSRRTKGVYGIALVAYQNTKVFTQSPATVIQRLAVSEPWEPDKCVKHELVIERAPRVAMANPKQLPLKGTEHVGEQEP